MNDIHTTPTLESLTAAIVTAARRAGLLRPETDVPSQILAKLVDELASETVHGAAVVDALGALILEVETLIESDRTIAGDILRSLVTKMKRAREAKTPKTCEAARGSMSEVVMSLVGNILDAGRRAGLPRSIMSSEILDGLVNRAERGGLYLDALDHLYDQFQAGHVLTKLDFDRIRQNIAEFDPERPTRAQLLAALQFTETRRLGLLKTLSDIGAERLQAEDSATLRGNADQALRITALAQDRGFEEAKMGTDPRAKLAHAVLTTRIGEPW